MLSVSEICEIAGVTRKTLFHYDQIGLLKPSARIGKQKIKMYDRNARNCLLEIRLYRFVGMPIELIRKIVQGNSGSREAVLQQYLMELKQERDQLEQKIRTADSLRRITEAEFQNILNSSDGIEQLKQMILERYERR